MKNYDYRTQKNNDNDNGTYYVDMYNDIHDTLDGAEIAGCVATIHVDSLYVGSPAEQRRSALEKYLNN